MNKIEFSNNPILLTDVLKKMDSLDIKGFAIPFSIIVSSSNITSTPGQTLVFENVILSKNAKKMYTNNKITVNNTIIDSLGNKDSRIPDKIKQVLYPDSGQIRNVNIRFITHFKSVNESKYRKVE